MEPKLFFHSHNTHNTVTDGFSGQPIANRQFLRRPTSTSPRLNGITSYMNHLTDIRHATIGATQHYRLPDSLVHCRPNPCRRSGAPPTHPTRSEEIRARALRLSRSEGTPKRSIALVELRHDEMLLALCSAAGYITKHGHIGT